MGNGRILMGVIGRPHGVRGLVRVVSYATDPATLATRPLADDRGRVWRLSWRGDAIAALTDGAGRTVADRTEAEALTNVRLFIERADLPAPEPDEFYLADLMGLEARDPAGNPIGRVSTVHDYGAGISLEIATAGTPLIVPFTEAAIPAIDLQARRLTVVAPDEIEVRGDLAPTTEHAATP